MTWFIMNTMKKLVMPLPVKNSLRIATKNGK